MLFRVEGMIEKPCNHCVAIRQTGEHWIAALHMLNWPMRDVAQLCAYIQARIRFHGLQVEGEATEKEFVAWFNRICDLEFKELIYANPQEPVKFDAAFDFRDKMGK